MLSKIVLDTLLHCGDKIKNILKIEKPMIITDEQEKEFIKCQVCHICNKKIKKDEVKVRDHDHINGLYRGCAHSDCNINFKIKNFLIPMFFII